MIKLAGVAFDPDARCPNWDAFLKEILDEPIDQISPSAPPATS